MSRETTLILLATLIVLIPFFGLPYSWIKVLIPVLGLVVVTIGIAFRIRRLHADVTPVPVSVASDETQNAI